MLGAVLAVLLISRGDLSDLAGENRALAGGLEEQGTVLAKSQSELVELRKANQDLGARFGDQQAALGTSGTELAELRKGNQVLGAKIDEQGVALGASQERLKELRQENRVLSTKLDEQRMALATSEKELNELRKQDQALTARVNNQQIFTYLQALPVVHKFVLKPTQDAPGTRGLLVSNPDKTWGVAFLLAMDPLKPGMGYQIWLGREGTAVSTGIVTEIEPESGFGQLYIVNFPEPLTKFTGVFVTLEPAKGSPAPSGKPLLAAPIK